jgi:hypothetical protein
MADGRPAGCGQYAFARMSTREAPFPRSWGRAPARERWTAWAERLAGRLAARPADEAVAVRRVRRVVRHVDLWSVFRFSLLLYLSFLMVGMVAGAGLWLVATITGVRHAVEHFIASTLLFKSFKFQSLQILLSTTIIGMILVGVGTGVSVLVAAFYNLISDVVGGVEVTVIEEEPAEPVV